VHHLLATYEPLLDPRWTSFDRRNLAQLLLEARVWRATIGEVVPQQELISTMPKRKVKELESGVEAPRRTSRRISTANHPPETASKPIPPQKRSRKTEKKTEDEEKVLNGKQEEDSEAVIPPFQHVFPPSL
jgi:hypothetical protein